MTTLKPGAAGRFAEQQPIASILAVVPDVRHAAFLHFLLDKPRIRLASVGSGYDALRYLWGNAVDVVICDESLPDCSWRDLIEEVSFFPHAPKVLLMCEAIRARTPPRGVHALLRKQYNTGEMFAALSRAVALRSAEGASQRPVSPISFRRSQEAVVR